MKVRIDKGEEFEVDCLYDREYIKKSMRRVGEPMRKSYYRVEDDVPLHLVLDNASGHGSNVAVEKFTNIA